LLVALAVGLQMIGRWLKGRTALFGLSTGLLFGAVGIVGMMTPLRFSPGVIYDGRSIVLSLAGLFGGPVAAAAAAVITGAYRTYLGGAGAIAGVSTIVEAAALGTALYYLRRRSETWVSPLRLWLFGVLVHAIMMALQLLIPGRTGLEVFRTIGPTVLILYPIAFVLLAQVFLNGERRQKAESDLKETEEPPCSPGPIWRWTGNQTAIHVQSRWPHARLSAGEIRRRKTGRLSPLRNPDI
jgi:LytS/YehU family sensor histidine kinase